MGDDEFSPILSHGNPIYELAYIETRIVSDRV
jgi:hypothetical protein